MALLQGTKKLFGPLLNDLDRVNAIKEAMELQVEACMKEEDEVAAAGITQAPSARARTSLRQRGPPWPMRPLRCSSLNDFYVNFFKSLINAFISFFDVNCRY
jgi:hypothetical protein